MDTTAVLDAPAHAEAEHEAAVAQRLREMERLEAQIATKQQQIERLQAETLTMLAELRERVTAAPKVDHSLTNGAPRPDTEEIIPSPASPAVMRTIHSGRSSCN